MSKAFRTVRLGQTERNRAKRFLAKQMPPQRKPAVEQPMPNLELISNSEDA